MRYPEIRTFLPGTAGRGPDRYGSKSCVAFLYASVSTGCGTGGGPVGEGCGREYVPGFHRGHCRLLHRPLPSGSDFKP